MTGGISALPVIVPCVYRKPGVWTPSHRALFLSIPGSIALQIIAPGWLEPSKLVAPKSETNTRGEDEAMNETNSAYRSNDSQDQSACAHCEGIFEHTAWCATQDLKVAYAYQIVTDASKVTFADSLILHSLGVRWTQSMS